MHITRPARAARRAARLDGRVETRPARREAGRAGGNLPLARDSDASHRSKSANRPAAVAMRAAAAASGNFKSVAPEVAAD